MSVKPAATRVVGVIQKAVDLECHVRVVTIDSVRLFELRDYIPSLKEYGRGYWMPLTESAVYGVMGAMNEILNSETVA